jgi:Na+/H+ antiporter NhaD/arsenite permease-like protein
MKKLEWAYMVLILLPVIVNGAYQICGSSEDGLLAENGMASYVINSLAVIVSLAAIYFCLKIFKFKKVSREVNVEDEELGRKAYIKWNAIRYVILGATLIVDFLASFLLADDSGLYCSVIVLIGCLFCHAGEKNFQMMREPENEKKE